VTHILSRRAFFQTTAAAALTAKTLARAQAPKIAGFDETDAGKVKSKPAIFGAENKIDYTLLLPITDDRI